MNKVIKNNNSGFTIVEMMVVIFILGITGTIVLDFVIMGFKATRFESEQAEAIKQARDAMDIMKKEIRGANQSDKGDYTLANIESDDVQFYSDIDNDGQNEKIHYYKNDMQLIKEVIEPGILKNYTETPTIKVIAEYVNNQSEPIFTYFNSDRVETTIINNVKLINIRLKINVTPEIAPADVYVETDVTFRNLKSNL